MTAATKAAGLMSAEQIPPFRCYGHVRRNGTLERASSWPPTPRGADPTPRGLAPRSPVSSRRHRPRRLLRSEDHRTDREAAPVPERVDEPRHDDDRRAAPNATVVVLGYLHVLARAVSGRWISALEEKDANALADALDSLISTDASPYGFTYESAIKPWTGHRREGCARSSRRPCGRSLRRESASRPRRPTRSGVRRASSQWLSTRSCRSRPRGRGVAR